MIYIMNSMEKGKKDNEYLAYSIKIRTFAGKILF